MKTFRIWYRVHAFSAKSRSTSPVTDVLHLDVNARDDSEAAELAYKRVMKNYSDNPGRMYYDLEFGEIKNITGSRKLRYYVAYGSNINVTQMERRCPTASIFGTGWIDDHYLTFGGRQTMAVATVKPRKGSKVPVLVWTIEELDERELDAYEGFPRFYRKEQIPVRMDDGKTIECMIYLLNPKISGVPSDLYVDIIREGYQDVGLDEKYLNRAVRNAMRRYSELECD